MPKKKTSAPAEEEPKTLLISHEEAKTKIEARIKLGIEIIKERDVSTEQDFRVLKSVYEKWHSYNKEMLLQIYSNREMADEYKRIVHVSQARSLFAPDPLNIQVKDFYETFVNKIRCLESFVERLDLIPLSETIPTEEKVDAYSILVNIFDRFHAVVTQLRQRHNNRKTLDVSDEYDVQDLLHSLLRLFFNDIRPEEYTPSYAGKSSKMDFILKSEQIVVEVKRSGQTVKAKELGTQLIEDIVRYEVHPDCKMLFCFVSDPEGIIANPRGIETDLNNDSPIPVRVLIRP